MTLGVAYVHRDLLAILCDPEDQTDLELVTSDDGDVMQGVLISGSGRIYPIVDGLPRFVSSTEEVHSFGAEWNHFNYDRFKANWSRHVVANTFGSAEVFRDQTVLDCGAGSGMQARWMAEAGARRVIALEMSHSVDGAMKGNLAGLANVDVIQCSIARPPIKRGSIDGIVICHNVLQHTRSVEETAKALWALLHSGQFVFNCYLKYPGLLWWLRWALIYRPLRAVLSRCPFRLVLIYAKVMAVLRFIPVLGGLLEKAQLVLRGEVPPGPGRMSRMYRAAVLNTFDWYGSHSFQHQKTPGELRALVSTLQPDSSKVRNLERYFRRPLPPGLAIRLIKS
jgi:uncharacterized protein YbaR (Trm112 family)